MTRSVFARRAALALLALFASLMAAGAVRAAALVASQSSTETVRPSPVASPTAAQNADDAVVVFLVRHAEKVDDSADSPLSDIGRERVQKLRAMLADVDFTHVHSTNLTRTRDTARPIAEDDGVELALYSPGELEELAETMRATPGRHLVSGHSNTTPRLAEALGAEDHGPIDDMEYDRLYIIVIQPGQPAVTTLLRF